MIESTARAERFDLQTSKSSYYLWEVPQKPIIVRIPFVIIDRLEGDVVDTFRSLNSLGSEIGGVLFGRAVAGELSRAADTLRSRCETARVSDRLGHSRGTRRD